jgi:hypothetical protein
MFIGGQRYELHFFSYNIRRFIYFSGFIADVGEEIVFDFIMTAAVSLLISSLWPAVIIRSQIPTTVR